LNETVLLLQEQYVMQIETPQGPPMITDRDPQWFTEMTPLRISCLLINTTVHRPILYDEDPRVLPQSFTHAFVGPIHVYYITLITVRRIEFVVLTMFSGFQLYLVYNMCMLCAPAAC